MPTFLNRLFGRAPEAKLSRTAPLVALAGMGRAVWSNRDTTELASHAYGHNAVVFRCVRMVAEAAAGIPAYAHHDGYDLDNHEAERLLARPNPRQSGRDLMETAIANLLLFGNAYIEQVSVDGVLRELHCLRPDRVRIVPGRNGWISHYEYAANGGSVVIPGDGEGAGVPAMLHLKYFDPLDDHYGLAPLAAARIPLEIHDAASAWNKALLDNSARPSGALVYAHGGANLSDEQFTRLKDELEGAFAGPTNAGRPMLLEGGLDWKPLSLSPKDMDFLEAKSAAAREIALAFGVPPLLLGLPGDNTHANYAEANRALWRQTAIPLARRVTEALAHWLSPAFATPFELKLDLDDIDALATEREARMKAVQGADYLTAEEKRAAAGYGRKKWKPDRVPAPEAKLFDAASWLGTGFKFDPDQPRLPAGGPGGGQWSGGGGGSGASDQKKPLQVAINDIGNLVAEIPYRGGGRYCVYRFDTFSVFVMGPVNMRCQAWSPAAGVSHGSKLNDN